MKNIYPPGTDNKPSVYQFDNTTMYDIPVKLQVQLITDKHNNNLRPIPMKPLGHVFPKPHKDLSFYHPGSEVIRNDINKSKNIPHKDYVPVYVPPYYDINETGFNNMRHENIFRKY